MAARPPFVPPVLLVPGVPLAPVASNGANGAKPAVANGGRKAAAEWRRFYAHPSVRRRQQEYLGGRSLESSPAQFLTSPSPKADPPARFRPVTDLPAMLSSELEVARSLWDRNSLLVHLDIEHVHFDAPWEPLIYPKRSLFVQRDVVAAIGALLCRVRNRGAPPAHRARPSLRLEDRAAIGGVRGAGAPRDAQRDPESRLRRAAATRAARPWAWPRVRPGTASGK